MKTSHPPSSTTTAKRWSLCSLSPTRALRAMRRPGREAAAATAVEAAVPATWMAQWFVYIGVFHMRIFSFTLQIGSYAWSCPLFCDLWWIFLWNPRVLLVRHLFSGIRGVLWQRSTSDRVPSRRIPDPPDPGSIKTTWSPAKNKSHIFKNPVFQGCFISFVGFLWTFCKELVPQLGGKTLNAPRALCPFDWPSWSLGMCCSKTSWVSSHGGRVPRRQHHLREDLAVNGGVVFFLN